MTKKELQSLHSEKCKVERVETNQGRGPEKRVVVQFSLTEGELYALYGLVVESERHRAVQDDVAAFFNNGLSRAGITLE
jgi:hypothetical protein